MFYFFFKSDTICNYDNILEKNVKIIKGMSCIFPLQELPAPLVPSWHALTGFETDKQLSPTPSTPATLFRNVHNMFMKNKILFFKMVAILLVFSP